MNSKRQLNTDTYRTIRVWFRALPMIILLLAIGAGILLQLQEDSQTPAGTWRDKIAWADEVVRGGNTKPALVVYSQIFREASLAEDWETLLAVACSLVLAGKLRGIGLTAETVLLRTIAVAHEKRSAQGIRYAAAQLKKLRVPDSAALPSTGYEAGCGSHLH